MLKKIHNIETESLDNNGTQFYISEESDNESKQKKLQEALHGYHFHEIIMFRMNEMNLLTLKKQPAFII